MQVSFRIRCCVSGPNLRWNRLLRHSVPEGDGLRAGMGHSGDGVAREESKWLVQTDGH